MSDESTARGVCGMSSLSWVPVPGRVLLESGIHYRNSDFTVA